MNHVKGAVITATASFVLLFFVPASVEAKSGFEQLDVIADQVVFNELSKRFGPNFAHDRLSAGHVERPECRVVGNMTILFGAGVAPRVKDEIARRVLERQGYTGMYQINNRWTQTATNPTTGSWGDPITVTYSYVPDGVFIPNSGLGSGNNTLHQAMNAAFGGSLWKTKIAEAFNRWQQLIGITFVEVSDDGASLHGSPGRNTAPIRGDVRISMFTMSSSGVIAYNFFPNTGDMVLNQSFTSSFANSSNNYRFLRNTIAHEHGHGFGLLHVDPANGTKLMEAFLNTNFDHAQSDDIQGGQRLYGDRFENNDTNATRRDLGTVANNQTVIDLSTDSGNDIDWFRVIVPAGKALTITCTPIGSTYQQGPEGGTVTTRDSLRIHNLRLSAYHQDGTTLLGLADAGGLGVSETLSNLVPPMDDIVHIRVDVTSGTTADVQRYQLTFNLSALTEAYAPNAVNTTAGQYVSGNVASVATSDNQYFIVQEAPTVSTVDPSTRVEMQCTGRLAPVSSITFRIEHSASALPVAAIKVRLEAFNVQTSTWEQIDERVATSGDSAYDVVISTNAGRFHNTATGNVLFRVACFSAGTTFMPGWVSRTDHGRVTVTYQ